MKPLSKIMKISMAIAATVALGSVVEAGGAWNKAILGSEELSEQLTKPAPSTLTRREFAEAIGRAVRGF